MQPRSGGETEDRDFGGRQVHTISGATAVPVAADS